MDNPSDGGDGEDGRGSGVEIEPLPEPNKSDNEAPVVETHDEQASDVESDSSPESEPAPFIPNSLMICVPGLSTEYPMVYGNAMVEKWTRYRIFSFRPEIIFGEKGSIETLDEMAEELLDFVLESAKDLGLELSELGLSFLTADLGGVIVKKALLRALDLVKYRVIYERTSVLFFCGTPHQDSKISSWDATILSIIEDTYRGLWGPWIPHHIRRLSFYLEKLCLDFHKILGKFRIINYVQDLPKPSSKVLTVHISCAELRGSNVTNIRRNVSHYGLTAFLRHSPGENYILGRIADAPIYVSKDYHELMQWLSLQSDGIETNFQARGRLNSVADIIARSKSLETSIYDDVASLISLELEAEVDGKEFLSCFSNAIRQTLPEYPGTVIACSSLTSTEPSSLTEIGLLSNCLLQMLKQYPDLYYETSPSFQGYINALYNPCYEHKVVAFWECLRLAFLYSHRPFFWVIHSTGTLAEEALILKITRRLGFFDQLSEGLRKVIIVTSSRTRIVPPSSKLLSRTFLDRETLKESIEKDLQLQLEQILDTNSRLLNVREEINQLLHEHGSNHKLMEFFLDALQFIYIPIPGTLARLTHDFTSTDTAFRVILDQVPHNFRVWVRKVLGSLCFSMRPMSIDELATVVIAADCENLEQLRKSITTGATQCLGELLPGIVRIESGKVYLVYNELKTFLCQNQDDWYYIKDYHSEVALACYHYLCLLIESFGIWGKSPLKEIVEEERRCRSYPGNIRVTFLNDQIFSLVPYASMYWCEHCLAPLSDAAASPQSGPWLKDTKQVRELLSLRVYSRWPFDQTFKVPDKPMPSDMRQAANISEIDAFEMTVQLVDGQPSKSCLDLIYFPTSAAEEALGHWIRTHFGPIDTHMTVTLYPKVMKALLQREKEATLNDISTLLMCVVVHNDLSFLMDLLKTLKNEVDLRDVPREALGDAVIWGFVDIVKALLGYQSTPIGAFRISPDTPTLLSVAVSTGNKEMVQLLLDAGAETTPQAEAGSLNITYDVSPLYVSCVLGLTDIVRLLLDAGADVDLPSSTSMNALHTASKRGFASTCRLLIEYGALITTDAENQSPLHHAARWYYKGSRYKKTTTVLIEALKSQFPGYREGSSQDSSRDAENLSRIINAQTRDGKQTALVHMAIAGDIDGVRSMIEAGAIASIGDEGDFDALSKAIARGNMDMVRYLLDNGARLDRKRERSRSYLHDACAWEWNDEVIEELLKQNMSVDQVDDESSSPIGMAVMWNLIHVVKQVIPRSSKETISLALNTAARYGYHEIVNTLLDAGANMNHQDSFGNTALQLSCWYWHPRITKILLARVPDINLSDNANYTPLSDAARTGATDCLKLLLDAGADTEIECESGRRPLFLAAETMHDECFRILLEHGAQAVLPEDIRRPEGSIFKEGLSFLAGLTYARVPNIVKAYAEHLRRQVSKDAFLSEINEALVVVVYMSFLESVQVLLELGADPNAVVAGSSAQYGSVIGLAFRNISIAREILDNTIKPVELNKVDDYRTTPLQFLMANGSPDTRDEMLDLLLERGADPSISSGSYGTVLNAACVVNDDGFFDKILNLPGVSRDIADDLGRLPLHISAQLSPTDSRMDLLVTESSTFRSTDKQGRNALHYAAAGGSVNRIEKVLNECPNLINTPDRDGWTALHWACRQDNVHTAEYLIRRGANEVAKSHDRWTPRHVAIYHGKTEHIDLFSEEDDDTDDEEVPSEAAEKVVDYLCDSCFCWIYGTGYICRTCPYYWLCFKCYWICEETHPKHHMFSRRDQDTHGLNIPLNKEPEAQDRQDEEAS
ncbi:ankyrin repeat-containing domain protein [Daldinia bambusicola]|nr:ankyrin repeat-containing domain protein [Daldinia bambusicola]